jgi:hypothetical protein
MADRTLFLSRMSLAEKLRDLLGGFITACFLIVILFIPEIL